MHPLHSLIDRRSIFQIGLVLFALLEVVVYLVDNSFRQLRGGEEIHKSGPSQLPMRLLEYQQTKVHGRQLICTFNSHLFNHFPVSNYLQILIKDAFLIADLMRGDQGHNRRYNGTGKYLLRLRLFSTDKYRTKGAEFLVDLPFGILIDLFGELSMEERPGIVEVLVGCDGVQFQVSSQILDERIRLNDLILFVALSLLLFFRLFNSHLSQIIYNYTPKSSQPQSEKTRYPSKQ